LKSIREHTLEKAIEIVTQDRNLDYSAPENNFADISVLWSTYLDVDVTPYDVAILNMLQKIARIKTSPQLIDHWIDISGYAACGAECAVNDNLFE